MGFKNRSLVVLFSVLILGLAVFGISTTARTETDPAPQQDVLRLETRISQLEQRFYTVETSVRSLEQQTRLGSVSSRTVNPEDVAQLRLEIQSLQRRLIEDECALAKLDERTLTPGARTRRRSAATDPCRLSPETPLVLPDH
jgi:anti-sigma28 factor (negative regulator of flagellin synthesis)